MNVVTNYTKSQLDRSAYISEDKYKKAFDINRIRLATQRLAGVDNKYAYYYNLYIFQNLVARLNKLGIKVSGKVTPDLSNYILDDERQIEIAEEEWGKELIDDIIDIVISDEDLGDYDKPKTEEEIKEEAESDASSDSDSDEYKMPPFNKKEGEEKPNPIQEKVEEEAKDKTEEIAKDAENGECDAKTAQEEFIKGADPVPCDLTPLTEGTKCGDIGEALCGDVGLTHIGCGSDLSEVFCTGDDSCKDVSCVIEYGDCVSDETSIHCIISCAGDANDGATDEGCANVGDAGPVCGDCDDPVCGDCDTCTGGDCCVSDIPCADTPVCGDTCGAGDYEPPICDTCGGDSGGCPADCCVTDCCIGDGKCASDSTCTNNCDCCVNDAACTNVSCNGDMDCGSNCDCPSDCGSNCDGSSCDCGSDCDNYGNCIDSCGGNE